MGMTVPNSEHGPLPITLVIRRLWGSPDVTYGLPSGTREYRDKLESTYLSSDPRRMWGGLRHITGYKGRNSNADQPAASLPDDLNTFYGRFEATNPLPSASRLAEGWG